ncbi:MAG: ribonuclease M5 [Bacillota bacterium]
MIEQFNKEVFVVEGNHDKAKLKSIYPMCDVVITNGKEISRDTLELLRALNASRGLILILDPDFPGKSIRQRINDYVGPTKHVFLSKQQCIDPIKQKVGLEHASIAYLKSMIDQHVLKSQIEHRILTMSDMVSLGLSGSPCASQKRRAIAAYFHLGECNAKTMLKRLNMFNIQKDAILKVIT